MRIRISSFRFAVAAIAVVALTSTASAQVQIIPGESSAGMSNGLPIGEPEATGGVYGEQQLRYDSPHPWMHGYWQEMPAYGGYGAFRPYNYKHVLAQSQAAGGWGMSPTMPYSQQFWHRYRQRASMRPQVPETAPTMSPTGYRSRFAQPPAYQPPAYQPPVSARRYVPPTASGPRFR